MSKKNISPAFSFKWTWIKLLKWAWFAMLAGLVAFLTNDIQAMDFWAFQSIVIASSLFLANSIKEFIQERK